MAFMLNVLFALPLELLFVYVLIPEKEATQLWNALGSSWLSRRIRRALHEACPHNYFGNRVIPPSFTTKVGEAVEELSWPIVRRRRGFFPRRSEVFPSPWRA